jgi:hypothetical protein
MLIVMGLAVLRTPVSVRAEGAGRLSSADEYRLIGAC